MSLFFSRSSIQSIGLFRNGMIKKCNLISRVLKENQVSNTKNNIPSNILHRSNFTFYKPILPFRTNSNLFSTTTTTRRTSKSFISSMMTLRQHLSSSSSSSSSLLSSSKESYLKFIRFRLLSTSSKASTTTTTTKTITNAFQEMEKSSPWIKKWLIGTAGLVASTIVLGGLTRLTESGLSMHDWKFLGQAPPWTEEEWISRFEAYKQYPEYQKLRDQDMSLWEFKKIFWFEYLHRQLGRVIGLTMLVPYVYGLATKQFKGKFALHGAIILSMIIGQGLLGWYMVKSGLKEELLGPEGIPRVSQYRLSFHLTSAFAVYTYLTALALKLHSPARYTHVLPARLRGLSYFVAALAGVTIFSGAYVAGLDAGLVYNQFPLMGTGLIPDGLFTIDPRWKNLFENTTTVQFNHRYLAMSTGVATTTLWFLSRPYLASLPPSTKRAILSVWHMSMLQIGLGISTLLMMVPVPLASAHQTGALTLWTLSVWLLSEVRKHPITSKIIKK